jgi:hypothetical protein
MSKNLLLLSSSIVFLCALSFTSHGSEAKHDHILSACPGAAKWEQKRAIESEDGGKHMVEKEPSLPLVRKQLIRLAAKDQAAREAVTKMHLEPNSPELIEIAKTDAANLQQLKSIISKYGVPSPAQIGEEGVRSLWLVVQHASTDIDLQESVLEDLKNYDYGVGKSEIAMMADRIRVAKGLPQTYGTQFRKVDGAFVPYEISDVENVDLRRAQMDLMPISDYLCVLKETYK